MDAKALANRLRALRGKKSRREICEATGINLTALANYENGLRRPCDDAKMKLADYYGVSVDELFFAS